MFIDEKYDYIERDKDYYDKVLNDMNNGLGTIEEYNLYLVRYKNDKDNKYIKRVLIKKDEQLNIEDNYEVYCTYYLTKLSYNDKSMIENEVFDLYYIKDIGYYEITDYYKKFNIKVDKDDSLKKLCLEYEKSFNKGIQDIRERDWLKLNTPAAKALKYILEAEDILISLDDYQMENNQAYHEIEDMMLSIGELRKRYTKYIDNHEELLLLKDEDI